MKATQETKPGIEVADHVGVSDETLRKIHRLAVDVSHSFPGPAHGLGNQARVLLALLPAIPE